MIKRRDLHISNTIPSSRIGLSTTKGISCSGSMYLCPALIIFIRGKQTTSVPGILACPWYQLRTVPGMSPDTIVLGECKLSFGMNTQQDCTSSWKREREREIWKGFSEMDQQCLTMYLYMYNTDSPNMVSQNQRIQD